jgi:hypothetical protein
MGRDAILAIYFQNPFGHRENRRSSPTTGLLFPRKTGFRAYGENKIIYFGQLHER